VIATKLGWTPKNVITNGVSATSTFLGIAAKSGSTITNGTISVNYLLDPTNPTYDSAAGMKLYRQIMAKYNPKGNVNDILNVTDGEGVDDRSGPQGGGQEPDEGRADDRGALDGLRGRDREPVPPARHRDPHEG
jgi:hypothetical protein